MLLGRCCFCYCVCVCVRIVLSSRLISSSRCHLTLCYHTGIFHTRSTTSCSLAGVTRRFCHDMMYVYILQSQTFQAPRTAQAPSAVMRMQAGAVVLSVVRAG